MNTYIILGCLLAVVGVHSNPVGIGGYSYGLGHGYGAILAPAISTANLVKAAPIPIIKPIISAPIVSVPVVKSVAVGGWGGYGLGGYGGWGGYGLGGYGGWGSGLGGYGLGLGGLGYGLGGKHYG